MTFHVEARPSGSMVSDSYYDAAEGWIKDKVSRISEMSPEDAVHWVKDRSNDAWEGFQRSFKYLTGAPTSSSSTSSLPTKQVDTEGPSEESKVSQFTGLFSSLRRTPSSNAPETRAIPQTFNEAEVHADFVRVRQFLLPCALTHYLTAMCRM